MHTQIAQSTNSLLIASGDATPEEARREADTHAAEAGCRITHLIRHTREDDLDWYEFATGMTMKCELCGRSMDRFEGGAYIGDTQIHLCHPDDETLPDCYSLWTRGSQPASRPDIAPID